MIWPTKKLGEIIRYAFKGLMRVIASRKSTISNEVSTPKVTIPISQSTGQKAQRPENELPAQETIKTEEVAASFLICPIQGNDSSGAPLTPYTVKISAVLDHSSTAIDPDSNRHWGKNAKDQKVKAFNGEIGEGAQCPQEPCGYPKKDGGEFFQNKEINYVGVSYDGGKNTLQYDGHAGYDFSYPKFTPVVAPADGKLYKAAQGKDLIYGANWNTDGSFYIVHENGFVTWFRHCEKLADSLETQILNDFTQFCAVTRGDVIAYVGNKGTRPVHLHFEVRDKDGEIVDPYKDKLWK
ncbi:M23 family metallopeptidase [Candidatus Wolfebacteria bacterium]|nr:M23 family metallopeptidase [Candidatus Wolfebacteria bacterium]